ncbi:Phosphatidylinositol 4-kinase LSB6 [Microbotryomycetes sp. JL221]|nr:Phosphatidylinositol 4-kinase LSB6 [Microbotryomycetes sp. JL221]
MTSDRPSRAQYAPIPASDLADVSQGDGQARPALSNRRSSRLRRHQPRSPLSQELDTLFRKWTATITQRMQLKKGRSRKDKSDLIDNRDRSKPVDILASVFEPWAEHKDFQSEIDRTDTCADKGKSKAENASTLDHEAPMTPEQFDEIVKIVKTAIEDGVHPRLNSKGSSGSYFARSTSGHTVAIFKPKDEEPYGRLNPKLTKYIHRVFLSRVIPFGRSCLIPNLSYLSESAASLLDRRLELHIVPRTQVVSLSSPAFYYDWIDRERAGRKGRLREKEGSFQIFLRGFTDASAFLSTYPIPGRPLDQIYESKPRRKGRVNLFGPLTCLCGRAEAERDNDDEYDGDEESLAEDRFQWTDDMLESFRLELEKLVILDYIIRNTDRGLDNFMIKACTCSTPRGSSTPVTTTEPPTPRLPMSQIKAQPTPTTGASDRDTTSHASSRPHVHVAAIDNSLAFPHAHPTGWRTFSYGWLLLPLSLVGRSFSNETKKHFLPKLTSPQWWSQTTLELRTEFAMDVDFKEKMFLKQMAVMKGQAYNVVQSMLDNEGPVELCRKPKRLVWDDFIEVADDDITQALVNAANVPVSHQTTKPVSVAQAQTATHSPSEITQVTQAIHNARSNGGVATHFEPASAPPASDLILASTPLQRPFVGASGHQSPLMDQVSTMNPRPRHSKSLSVSSILSANGMIIAPPRSSPGLSGTSITTPSDVSDSIDQSGALFEHNSHVDQKLSESVTGIDMLRHMDWVEYGEGRGKLTRQERRRQRELDNRKTLDATSAATVSLSGSETNRQRQDHISSTSDGQAQDAARTTLEEHDDEDEFEDHVGDLSWGVMSEGARPASSSFVQHHLFPSTASVIDPNSDNSGSRPTTRHRSGSLTNLPSSFEAVDAHQDLTTRRQSEHTARSSFGTVRRPSLFSAARSRYSAGAERVLSSHNRETNRGMYDNTNFDVRQRVVVVERLETLKDEPKPSFVQFLCGTQVDPV